MKKVFFFAVALVLLTVGVYGQNTALDAMLRGISLSNQKNYDKAITEFNTAIRLDPNMWDAYFNRGLTYTRMSDWDRAIADYTQAIRIDPSLGESYYRRGEAYQRKNDNTRAKTDYESALRILPDHAQAKQALASLPAAPAQSKPATTTQNNAQLAQAAYERGVAAYKQHDFDKAIKELTEAIRLNPNHYEAYNIRADSYGGKKDHNRAVADYEASLRIKPDQPRIEELLSLERNIVKRANMTEEERKKADTLFLNSIWDKYGN